MSSIWKQAIRKRDCRSKVIYWVHNKNRRTDWIMTSWRPFLITFSMASLSPVNLQASHLSLSLSPPLLASGRANVHPLTSIIVAEFSRILSYFFLLSITSIPSPPSPVHFFFFFSVLQREPNPWDWYHQTSLVSISPLLLSNTRRHVKDKSKRW